MEQCLGFCDMNFSIKMSQNLKNKGTLISCTRKVSLVKVFLFFHFNPVMRVKTASEIMKIHAQYKKGVLAHMLVKNIKF